jgi:hypothetical protein
LNKNAKEKLFVGENKNMKKNSKFIFFFVHCLTIKRKLFDKFCFERKN